MPSRRAFLVSLGTVVTGCTASRNGPTTDTGRPSATDTSAPSATDTSAPPTTDETDVSVGETVRVGDVRVTVSDPVVSHSVRYLPAPDAVGVVTAADGQFVFVRVSVEGDGRSPAPDDVRLVVDGTRFTPGLPDVGPARVDAPVSAHRYGDGTRRGYLAVRVPTPRDATAAAVVLDGTVRWRLPASTLDALRSPPPSFASSVDVPARVPADDPIPVRLDVTNEGGVTGVFRGGINHQGPRYGADPFAFPVDSGASVAREYRIDYHLESNATPERVQFGVVGPGLSRSFEVDVERGETQTGTATTTGTR